MRAQTNDPDSTSYAPAGFSPVRNQNGAAALKPHRVLAAASGGRKRKLGEVTNSHAHSNAQMRGGAAKVARKQ